MQHQPYGGYLFAALTETEARELWAVIQRGALRALDVAYGDAIGNGSLHHALRDTARDAAHVQGQLEYQHNLFGEWGAL